MHELLPRGKCGRIQVCAQPPLSHSLIQSPQTGDRRRVRRGEGHGDPHVRRPGAESPGLGELKAVWGVVDDATRLSNT